MGKLAGRVLLLWGAAACGNGPAAHSALTPSDGGTVVMGPVTVSVSPTNAQATIGGSVQFQATVGGSSNTSVSWAVQEGSAGGSVSALGLYVAPSATGMYHVIATSNADTSKSATGTVSVTEPTGTPPPLQVGQWTNISPPGVPFGGASGGIVFSLGMALDPANPRTLYDCVDGYFNSNGQSTPANGVYKTTDGGTSWKRMGPLDGPVEIAVDPGNSSHLYVADGVRGSTQGFWVSNDGGDTWTQPAGFKQIATSQAVHSYDSYGLATDPSDFNHILLSFHSGWATGTNAGIVESTDGGNTWVAHQPMSNWGGLGYWIMFLSSPANHLGDRNTWLLGTQQTGFWKTTDGAQTWTQVATDSAPHDGSHLFYSSSGTVYLGANYAPMRSTDNGSTWTSIMLQSGYYCAVYGDGNTLYAKSENSGTSTPVYVSPESDGTNWTKFDASGMNGTFAGGSFQMAFDSVNNILYASNWEAGMWALKVK